MGRISKSALIGVIFFLGVSLCSCGNDGSGLSQTTESIEQYRAIDVTGESLDSAIADLKTVGFTVIKSNADSEPDKTKWIVVKQSIPAGTEFTQSDVIELTCLHQITVPDVTGYKLADALETLESMGLENVTSNDNSDPAWDKDRWIVASQSIAPGTDILPTDALTLSCSKLCHLYIDVSSEANWFFSTYDMEIYVDDTNLGAVPNGKEFTKLVDVMSGSHEFTAYKGGDHSIKGAATLDVNSDITFKCDISHGSSDIEFKNMEKIEDVKGASLEVPNVERAVLSDAMSDLQSIGFSNVRYEPYSDIWDTSNWTVLSQNIEAGESVDKNEEIILQCEKTDQYLADNFSNKDAVSATQLAKEWGLTVGYIDNTRNLYIGKNYLACDESKQRKWIVKNAAYKTGDNSNIEFRMYYTGDVEVPDVMNLSLTNALQKLKDADFSNVEYKSEDGSSIWDSDNWEVIKQSTVAGSKQNASNKINLIVRHYSDKTPAAVSSSTKTASAPQTTQKSSNDKPAESMQGKQEKSESKPKSNTGKKGNSKDSKKPGAKKEIKVNYEKHFAFRAAVAATTNYFALDVFTADGNDYDLKKFHKYSDLSGNTDDYLMVVTKQGTWTAKSSDTWHVNHLCMYRAGYGSEFDLSLDVTKKDGYYWVHNISDPLGTGRDFGNKEEENMACFKVSPNLVDKGRDDKKLADITGYDSAGKKTAARKGLEESDARELFLKYCKVMYPYGVKLHSVTDMWGEQYSDGSWYFEVGADVKSIYGTKYKTTLYGTIDKNGSLTDFGER